MESPKSLLQAIAAGDKRALARAITSVENELPGADELLENLNVEKQTPIIGITGPPGAGKSTLINALIAHLLNQNFKIGILAIDPTSPFNHGSLLGDRVRMSAHFLNDQVFIRSLATRGSLGGLSAKAIEITEVMKAAAFDFILVETVGVGQSEVEIVGLADCTVLVLVPEAGDDVQSLKSGVMEIADIFVVNKADRPGAGLFLKNLNDVSHNGHSHNQAPSIVKTIATNNEGVEGLFEAIKKHLELNHNKNKSWLLTEKAFQLIQSQRMRDIDKVELKKLIESKMLQKGFNLYQFVRAFI